MPQLRRPVPRAERVEVDNLDSPQTRYTTGSRRAARNAKPRAIRNGQPITRPYRWRSEPRARHAVDALARARAEHGQPD